MDQRLQKLIEWIRDSASFARGLMIPISGGSDSALVFWLICQVYREKTVGVFAGSKLRSRKWFESVGTVRTIPMLRNVADKEAARWAAFLSMMRREERWLVGARNRTEDLMGTYSLASRAATYLPIVGVWKTDVMELCDIIGVPREVTESSRKADPDCGRPEELAEVPLELIDTFLRVREGELPESELAALSARQVTYLDEVLARNKFKRQLPVVGPRIGS